MSGISPDEWHIIWLSLRVAVKATGFALIVALAFGILLRRPFRGRALLDTLLHVPLVLPPVVTGFLLLLVFGLQSPVGRLLDQLGLRLIFTENGAALAAAITAFPLMMRAIRLALEAVDPRLEMVARTLGAGRVDRLFSITLPLAFPGIMAAAIIGFAVSMGAFGAVITFAANIPGETRTIPLAIYTALQMPDGGATAVRLSLVAVAISFVALLLSEALVSLGRRRAGA